MKNPKIVFPCDGDVKEPILGISKERRKEISDHLKRIKGFQVFRTDLTKIFTPEELALLDDHTDKNPGFNPNGSFYIDHLLKMVNQSTKSAQSI